MTDEAKQAFEKNVNEFFHPESSSNKVENDAKTTTISLKNHAEVPKTEFWLQKRVAKNMAVKNVPIEGIFLPSARSNFQIHLLL